jgi:hypothetical protein
MTYLLVLVALCLLGAFALQFWVYDVNRWSRPRPRSNWK